MIPFKVGNNAEIIKLDSKAYRLAQGSGTEKISHFRVKTSDYKMYDDVTLAKGEAPPYSYDDIVLTENPKQTSITWKNKELDAGNDQHIVIDKVNKETKFVDDNWRMEEGGEDIIKDDWVEYVLPGTSKESKKRISREMGLAKGDEVDNKFIDGYSVDDMDEYYADMFRSYVDSFSPSGNIFGSVERMQLKMAKENKLKLQKIEDDLARRKHWDEQDRLKEKQMDEWEDQFRGGFGMHAYNKGGEVKYDYFNDVVPPLEPVDNFQLGGLFGKGAQIVIKKGPKVIEKLREFAPAIAGKVGIPKLKKPWAVFDKKGNPVKDFRLKKEADSWLKGEKDVEG
ncbi:MAG: hypothetical protein QF745_10175, partial [Planctomycetota bacterium]|nr:hypothetical protein [Planctomycetota bacterium]